MPNFITEIANGFENIIFYLKSRIIHYWRVPKWPKMTPLWRETIPLRREQSFLYILACPCIFDRQKWLYAVRLSTTHTHINTFPPSVWNVKSKVCKSAGLYIKSFEFIKGFLNWIREGERERAGGQLLNLKQNLGNFPDKYREYLVAVERLGGADHFVKNGPKWRKMV